MSERDDLAAALRRCVPDGTWLEAATRLLASDWLAAHDADVRRAPVVDQPEHTVAWQDKANIICGCGQVFSHDYGKSPAPILGSTSDYYLRTHCGTLYARHLRDVRTTNAADIRRAERARVAEALRAHPPTYTEHAADPQTFYCPPCSTAIGDWVEWTPEHVMDALAREATDATEADRD